MERQVELLRIKNNLFGIVYANKNDPILQVEQMLKDLPRCHLDKHRLTKIQKIYKEIKENYIFSLEDVYSVFGGDDEMATPLFCSHKRQCVRNYRNQIHKIINSTKKQIAKNVNRINVCSLTYSMFLKMQEFTEEKPKYIANLWLLGNSTQANIVMREAFEAFTRADISKKSDTQFCLERVLQLLDAIAFSIKDSFRIHHLDSVLDQFYYWYFVESSVSYDFLIFPPEAFDEVRDFLLDTIDKNPFMHFLKESDVFYEKCSDSDTCLDSDNIIFIEEELFNEIKSFRELSGMLEGYYSTHKALRKYGMFDCVCYDLTNKLPKETIKRALLTFADISEHCSDQNQLCSYTNVIHDKVNFVRFTIKPALSSYGTNLSKGVIQPTPTTTNNGLLLDNEGVTNLGFSQGLLFG